MNQKNSSNTIENILISILGSVQFAKLKSFFIDILNKSCDIYVFTTRRSHLLFCIFKKYILSESYFSEKKERRYITDQALDFYECEIKRSNVLVIDDILVHGRALASVVDKVAKLHPQKIEPIVFVMGEDVINIDNINKSVLNVKSNSGVLKKAEWQALSNQIVASIILTSTPYASYIFSIYKEMSPEEFSKFNFELKSKLLSDRVELDTKMDLTLNEYDNNSDLSKKNENNVKAYIYPIKTNIQEDCSFLRVYYNKLTETCIVIPFFIMGTYTELELLNQSKKIFGDKFKKVEPALQYRILTAYYSFLLLENEDIKLIIDKNKWNNSKDYVEMCYYPKFYDDINNAISKNEYLFVNSESIINNIEDINNYRAMFNDENAYTVDEKIFYDVYLNVFKELIEKSEDDFLGKSKHSLQTVFLHSYLTNVNENEEKYIDDCKELGIIASKQKGLSFEIMKLLISNIDWLNMSSFDLFSKCISGADSGLITISPNKFVFNEKIYYSNFLITGEQVCRLYQNELFIFLMVLKNFYYEYNEKLNLNCNFKSFIQDNLNEITSDSKKRNLLLKELDSVLNEDTFVEKNIYEKIYDEELKFYLENILC